MTATILVVDDEPDIEEVVLQHFHKQINDERLAFLFAHDGLEALRVVDESPQIELILLDINMPRMDGLSMLQKMQAADNKKATVIVSAYGDMDNRRPRLSTNPPSPRLIVLSERVPSAIDPNMTGKAADAETASATRYGPRSPNESSKYEMKRCRFADRPSFGRLELSGVRARVKIGRS